MPLATTGRAPVRGTQTFVGVMSAVWGRPSLTAIEIGWRWIAGIAVLVTGLHMVESVLGIEPGHAAQPGVMLDPTLLRGLSVFQPVHALEAMHGYLAPLIVGSEMERRWFVPCLGLLWLIGASFGRTLVLRRLDVTLRSRRWTIFWLGALRVGALAAFWYGWVRMLTWATRTTITGPAARGTEPSLVLFSAIAICGTLFLYVLWAVVSWPLQLAPLLAMLRDEGVRASLTAAFLAGPVRAKLMEINMVMHIVKLALIVLAMVFSASPLPFTTVATETFLACWWAGVILLYFAASDYFHVVRSAAYLALWKAYHFPGQA